MSRIYKNIFLLRKYQFHHMIAFQTVYLPPALVYIKFEMDYYIHKIYPPSITLFFFTNKSEWRVFNGRSCKLLSSIFSYESIFLISGIRIYKISNYFPENVKKVTLLSTYNIRSSLFNLLKRSSIFTIINKKRS